MRSTHDEGTGSYPAPGSAYYTVCALSLAYMFSYIDRQIPALLIENIKADLRISDTRASLLAGFAFALFYSTAAIPIAWLADRRSRKLVILAGVALWGLMTMACGLARSFVQFFIARMGVGLGEAALTPSAYAMVTDLFPPERQARGMGIFVIGSSIGSGLALIVGGLALSAAESFGPVELPLVGVLATWQIVLLGVGAGTLLVLIPLSVMHDPQRQGPSGHHYSVGAIAGMLWERRGAFATLFLGVPLISMAAYGFLAWTPAYFIRIHGWEASSTGLVLGAIGIAGAVAGVVGGTWLADRLRAAGMADASLKVLILATLLTAPVGLLFGFVGDYRLALAIYALFAFITGPVAALGPLALQSITPNGMRAQVSSLFLLMANLIGLGLGPTVVALTTDFGFADEGKLGFSISIVTFVGFLASALIIAAGRKAYREALQL